MYGVYTYVWLCAYIYIQMHIRFVLCLFMPPIMFMGPEIQKEDLLWAIWSFRGCWCCFGVFVAGLFAFLGSVRVVEGLDLERLRLTIVLL